MLKFLFILTLIAIAGHVGVTALSCGSCGSECATACGTRRFRTCCFNYLRRKRGPDMAEVNVPDGVEDADEDEAPYPVPDERGLWWGSPSSKGVYGFKNQ